MQYASLHTSLFSLLSFIYISCEFLSTKKSAKVSTICIAVALAPLGVSYYPTSPILPILMSPHFFILYIMSIFMLYIHNRPGVGFYVSLTLLLSIVYSIRTTVCNLAVM
jgi:hypothetical protein